MPTADYSSYHQNAGTTSDGAKFNNLIDAVQATVNGLDNNNIAALAGIDASKIAAAYSTYTPTWSCLTGSAPSLGNGTLTGRYQQIGKRVHLQIELTAGSTTTFGSGGEFVFALPVTAQGAKYFGVAELIDTSASAGYAVTVRTETTTTAKGLYHAVAAATIQEAAITNASPFAWATADIYRFSLVYEAA